MRYIAALLAALGIVPSHPKIYGHEPPKPPAPARPARARWGRGKTPRRLRGRARPSEVDLRNIGRAETKRARVRARNLELVARGAFRI